MKIFKNLFGSKEPSLQIKSNSSNFFNGLLDTALFDGYLDYDAYYLMAYKCLLLYKVVSPVNIAIDIIAEEFANFEPCVWDIKENKIVEDHEVLELLAHPYGDLTWNDFATELAVFYLATGNSYVQLTGNIRRPPLEMMNVHPGAISIIPSTIDGYNQTYIAAFPIGTTEYNRDDKLIPSYFRYVNQQQTKELWHIRKFSPKNMVGTAYYGMSPLNPIYLEIEQHFLSSKHNRGLLRNGAKLSTVFMVKNALSTDSFARLQEQISKFAGPGNAGKHAILEDGVDAKELGLSNKDMDFQALKANLELAIYNKLRIPLPMVFPERATMNNVEESRLQLYDNAVFPLANRLFKELSLLLMPRYKADKNLTISFRHDKIAALESRKVTQNERKSTTEIFTINELRDMYGYEPVEGGDEIYRQSSQIPISSLADDDITEGDAEISDDITFSDGQPVKSFQYK